MGSEIVFTAKRKVEVLDYDDAPLTAHAVRGRTLTTLISPGTELAWVNGDNFPLRPGYAATFEVEEVGKSVTTIARGDRLLCMGAHRSTQQFDARYTLKIPDSLSSDHAVLARLMGVSMTTLITTKARPGDIVIVTGAGPVGYLAAHQCRIAGYEVLVIEPNPLRREQASASGLTVVAAMPLGEAQYQDRVAMVIDCSGHEQAVLDGCKIVRKGGEVVLVGVPWKAYTSILAHEILNAVFFRYVALRSGWEWEVPLLGRDFVWEELYEGYNNAQHSTFSGLAKALAWLDKGQVPLDAGMLRGADPRAAQATYDSLLGGQVKEPFVVFDWSSARL